MDVYFISYFIGENLKYFYTLDKKIRTPLDKLTKSGQITKQDQLQMKSNGPILPQFYGRLKLDNPNIPLRPIVSLPAKPTYNLSKKLFRKLNYLTESCDHSINSSIQFLEKIKNIKVEDKQMMVSFDVIALYTSISAKVATETMQQLLYSNENIKTQCSSWIELIKLCLTTYFQFNTQICEQIKGTPMGLPISGIIA
uniref:Reverse transcriptase domain-containing protein n=1 Tax=Trichobilharzia regenti TaxID=157069 RepID=A0AA85IZK7_TRIRE|nr:unnamed protein product [Trichobilharzia regenti]